MTDPLAEVVMLLRPQAPSSKLVSAYGPWQIHRTDAGNPFFFVILNGSCTLRVEGDEPINCQQNDFVLIPEARNYCVSSTVPAPSANTESVPSELSPGIFQLGEPQHSCNARMLIGHCVFDSKDARLLVPLLPRLIHIREDARLTSLVQLVNDETRHERPARDIILERLLEVLLIEAFRSTSGIFSSPGLMRGLADERIAVALRQIHTRVQHAWTIAALAKECALSRSTFFERFQKTVGVTPMEYLLTWRMSLAKKLLEQKQFNIAEIADQVGYGSASTFSVAFTRHAGYAPSQHMARDVPVQN